MVEPGSALPDRNRNSHPKIHRFKRILYPPLPGEATNLKKWVEANPFLAHKLWDIARSKGASEGSWPVAQCAECTEVLGR